jgi:hypothetical protein
MENVSILQIDMFLVGFYACLGNKNKISVQLMVYYQSEESGNMDFQPLVVPRKKGRKVKWLNI